MRHLLRKPDIIIGAKFALSEDSFSCQIGAASEFSCFVQFRMISGLLHYLAFYDCLTLIIVFILLVFVVVFCLLPANAGDEFSEAMHKSAANPSCFIRL